MVVTLGAVGVAVGEFLLRSLPDLHHLYIKGQGLAGQRVIGVHGYLISLHRQHGERVVTIVGLSVELHPHIHRLVLRKLRLIHLHHPGLVSISIGFFRGQGDRDAVAGLLASQRRFQTRHDGAGPMKVHNRFAALLPGAVQNLPVRMMLDRGGFVGNDGPTHHGCYDLAYMGCIPNLTIMAPSDEIELRNMVKTCADFDEGPTVLRYPRGVGYGADKLENLFGYKLDNGEIPTKGK